MDEPHIDLTGMEGAPSTDEVLSESVERVKSSRKLIDQIEHRLQRGHRLLHGDGAGPTPSSGSSA